MHNPLYKECVEKIILSFMSHWLNYRAAGILHVYEWTNVINSNMCHNQFPIEIFGCFGFFHYFIWHKFWICYWNTKKNPINAKTGNLLYKHIGRYIGRYTSKLLCLKYYIQDSQNSKSSTILTTEEKKFTFLRYW